MPAGSRILFEARAKIGAWKEEYNEERPHSSLGYLAPREFARRVAWGKSHEFRRFECRMIPCAELGGRSRPLRAAATSCAFCKKLRDFGSMQTLASLRLLPLLLPLRRGPYRQFHQRPKIAVTPKPERKAYNHASGLLRLFTARHVMMASPASCTGHL